MDRMLADAALFRGIESHVVGGLTAQLQAIDFAPGQIIYTRDATAGMDRRLFRHRGWIRVDGKSVLISDSERLAHPAH